MNWKQSLMAFVAVIAVAVAGWFAWPPLAPPPAPQPLFADWAAIVVAGDWRAQSGQPSEVFDNGRREIAKKLVSIGFRPENMQQFSVQPQKYPGQNIQPATGEAITHGLTDLARKAMGGCMVYFTSHGTEEGVIVGDRLVDPAPMAELIDAACGERPAIIVISACFAGQFIGKLKGPKRIVFTAARGDRTSFGCGAQDEYTFFDTCVLGEIDGVASFPALADGVKACVRAREAQINADAVKAQEEPYLPSEPQFFLGPQVAHSLNWK